MYVKCSHCDMSWRFSFSCLVCFMFCVLLGSAWACLPLVWGHFLPMIFLKIWSVSLTWGSSPSSRLGFFVLSHISCTFLSCVLFCCFNSYPLLIWSRFSLSSLNRYSIFYLINSACRTFPLRFLVVTGFFNSVSISSWVLCSVCIVWLNSIPKSLSFSPAPQVFFFFSFCQGGEHHSDISSPWFNWVVT